MAAAGRVRLAGGRPADDLAGYLLPAAPAEPYAHLDTGGSAAKGLRDARVEAGFPAELPAT